MSAPAAPFGAPGAENSAEGAAAAEMRLPVHTCMSECVSAISSFRIQLCEVSLNRLEGQWHLCLLYKYPKGMHETRPVSLRMHSTILQGI